MIKFNQFIELEPKFGLGTDTCLSQKLLWVKENVTLREYGFLRFVTTRVSTIQWLRGGIFDVIYNLISSVENIGVYIKVRFSQEWAMKTELTTHKKPSLGNNCHWI